MNVESRNRIVEWDSRIDKLGYEEILGVPADATREMCRQAYYKFARIFHPDSHTDADPVLRDALTRVFQRGAEAYRVLSDPALRMRWLDARSRGALRLTDSATDEDIDLAQELPQLHIHCRSAGAILLAKQAHSAFKRGSAESSLTHLRKALEYEGGANVYIARCLRALETTAPATQRDRLR